MYRSRGGVMSAAAPLSAVSWADTNSLPPGAKTGALHAATHHSQPAITTKDKK